MLVAAGFGTRLDPLTRELPKGAVPVGNRPLAWYALDHLARWGAREVVANSHHLAPRLREQLDAACPAGLRLEYAHEPEILGTGGGVRNAWRRRDQELLVFNAKLLYAPDLHAALRRHRESGAIATMVLRSMPAGGGLAAVEVDGEGWVRRIRGRPTAVEAAGLRARMYSGVQILSPRAWRDLPERGDIIDHAYLRWLARGEAVGAVFDDGPWLDAGISLAHYLEANLALASGRVRWPGVQPEASGCLIAPGAQIGKGSTLHGCVVGAGAEVAAGVMLRDVVVWPGASAAEPLQRAVVTPQRVVQLNAGA